MMFSSDFHECPPGARPAFVWTLATLRRRSGISLGRTWYAMWV